LNGVTRAVAQPRIQSTFIVIFVPPGNGPKPDHFPFRIYHFSFFICPMASADRLTLIM
jgi:hypothetical protein